MHVCLVLYCRAGFIGGNERVVVRGKVGERITGTMNFELILDFCRAEEGIGNQPMTFRKFLDYKKSAPVVCDVKWNLITLLSDMTNLIVELMDSLILMWFTG